MSVTSIIETYSDMDMSAPASWENGFKEGRAKFGDADRYLSNPVTGDPRGSTFALTLSDADRRFRRYFKSSNRRYWSLFPFVVKMTDVPTYNALGTPYTVFVGPVTDAQPRYEWDGARLGLYFDFTLSDIVFQGLLSDQAIGPWRQIKDGPMSRMISVPKSLNLEDPEPSLYGAHVRVPGVDPPSSQAFVYLPIYIGVTDIAGTAEHTWLVCAHATSDVLDAYVIDPTASPSGPSSILGSEGSVWKIPHHSGHTAQFGAPYEDYRSDTYGTLRRYTFVYGKVGETDPDACAAGTKVLALALHGVEDKGDATGDLIVDRIMQRKHWAINYLANQGSNSYQSGDWKDNPTWDVFGVPVGIIDEDSYDVASAIAAIRLPAVGSPPVDPAGYIGAGVYGGQGTRKPLRQWVADWNRSCALRSGFTRLGRERVVMLHPTAEIKAAAKVYTATQDILKSSFQSPIRWADQQNGVPYRGDYDPIGGQFATTGIATADESVGKYQRLIMGDTREFPFTPGLTHLHHVARMAALENQHPPDSVILDATVGPDPLGDSLGYREVGDYIVVEHPAQLSESRTEQRLKLVTRIQVQAGRRRTQAEALDVEDLIDFDLPPDANAESVSPRNETCDTAIDMGDLSSPFAITLDTSTHATDESVTTSPPFGGSGVAYHAAWFKLTGNIFDGVATLSAAGSLYDTQMVVFEGSCGALVQVGFNDNFAGLLTSVIDQDIIGGTDYLVLVCGYGPADGGVLKFSAVFTPNEP